MIRRSLLIALLPWMVAGCELPTWFGAPEAPPLPGERVSVMVHENALKPDAGAADEALLLPAPSPNPTWPQAGGFPNHAMHHIEVNDTLSEAWSSSIGVGSDDEEKFVSSPVVADGRVFAMDAQSQVTALDAATGDRIWQVELTPDEEDDGHIGGGVAYYKGRVFATTGFAQVIALDAGTGAVLWRQNVLSPMRAAPTVRNGRVFAPTLDNRLFALSAEDGSTLWIHEGVAESAAILGSASPAVDAGVVVTPLSSGELVALKVENGRQLWVQSLSGNRRTDVVSELSHIRGRPVIDRGLVFAISHGGLFTAIDLRTGRRVWTREIGGIESPWVAGDYLFVLTNEGVLSAIGRTDGTVYWVTELPLWKYPEDREGRIIWTGPLLASDRLIIAGSSGSALAVSPYSGNILGSVDMPDAVTVAPVIADKTVYFLSDDAELVAYR